MQPGPTWRSRVCTDGGMYAQMQSDGRGDVRPSPRRGCRVARTPCPFWKMHLRQNPALWLHPGAHLPSAGSAPSCGVRQAELVRRPGGVRSRCADVPERQGKETVPRVRGVEHVRSAVGFPFTEAFRPRVGSGNSHQKWVPGQRLPRVPDGPL